MGLDTVELVMEFEEEFGIEIPNEAAEAMVSVRHVRDFIVAELQRQNHAADPQDVFERVRRLTSEKSSVDTERITLDTTFVDDLGLD